MKGGQFHAKLRRTEKEYSNVVVRKFQKKGDSFHAKNRKIQKINR